MCFKLIFTVLIWGAIHCKSAEFPKKLSLEKIQNTETIRFQYKKSTVTSVLFFWASWCSRCKEVLPDISKLEKDSKIKVIGISVDENKADGIASVKKEYSLISRQYWLSPKLATDLKVNMIPLIVLIDKKGRIDTIYEGSHSDKMSYFKKRIKYIDENGGLDGAE